MLKSNIPSMKESKPKFVSYLTVFIVHKLRYLINTINLIVIFYLENDVENVNEEKDDINPIQNIDQTCVFITMFILFLKHIQIGIHFATRYSVKNISFQETISPVFISLRLLGQNVFDKH